MLELGNYQTLEVVKKTDFGYYLSEPGTDGKHKILLPTKEAPADIKEGDQIEVFIYKDSEDREIATSKRVPFTIGGLAVLKVKEVSKIGAFLDWGLAKDLLLPYKEQTIKVEQGSDVLVSLYLDKSKRLCATMKVYDKLQTNSPYKKDDLVTGNVYDMIDTFGAFVAVDNKFSAMIPNNELFKTIKIGDTIEGRVITVRDDGKLTLSLRDKAYVQMDSDSDTILNKLKEAGGFLPFHDKSDSEDIKTTFQMSKNAFKRAVGKLYKSGAIIIADDGIRLK